MKCNLHLAWMYCFVFSLSTVLAQKNTTVSEVYKQYLQGNFSEAKKGLDILLNQQPNNVDFLWKRAMCSLESNPVESTPFLERCAALQPYYHPLLFWYLGKCYAAQQEYEKAIQAYERYKPNNPIKAEKAIEQVKMLQTYLKQPVDVRITLLDTHSINTLHDEYAPFLFKNQLAFTRSINGQEEIFYLYNDTLKKLVEKHFDQKFQRSMPHFVHNHLYFYYNADVSTNGDIYIQVLENHTWTKPEKLSDSINSKAWETAPTTDSAEKILVFASDRKGGYGGSDLYFSVKNAEGKWKTALNMGNIINTQGDESNPHLSPDGKKLYFISNGHATLGGFDIFVSYFENGNWTKPQNVGYPLNTPYNELNYYVIDSLHAYLSSDRPCLSFSKLNSNLYLVEYPVQKKVQRNFVDVFIAAKNERQQHVPFTLQVQDNLKIDTTYSPIQHFTLPKNTRLAVTVSAKGYLSQNLDIITTQQDTLWLYPTLEAIQNQKSYVIKNIYFKFNSSELEAESYPALDELVSMLKTNPTIRIQINGHTDNTGSANKNLILSEERAKSVAQYLISKGIETKRIITRGYGSQRPIADNTTEEGRYKNRRVEFEIIP
ncbi:MAG: OmpA family protein [Bacteroidia bacterium]|nr:OmpA family protein [Bacteroidia bacterium]